ncbi:MAG: type II toxin-antitoxin system MqsA family antitoxin [Nitrospirae bacterium]|nr:type II toxin-antitoxin system MqsA family antitoxin [Nitrospirota bacterium]
MLQFLSLMLLDDESKGYDNACVSGAMTPFADCTFCGGPVEERRVDYDYRRKGRLLIMKNVLAGVCRQCGEKYFKPDVLKRMDQRYHDIVDRNQKPEAVVEIPAVSF